MRSLQEGWAQVEPPSPGAPPAIIDRGPLCQQHASVGGVPLPMPGLGAADRLNRSARRACRPWAGATNSRDRVPHDEARLQPLRNGDFSIGRDVDLGVFGHQVPDAGAGFYRRPCINDCIRVDPDPGLSRYVERKRDAGVASMFLSLMLSRMWVLTRSSPSSPIQMTVTWGLPSGLMVLRWAIGPDSISSEVPVGVLA